AATRTLGQRVQDDILKTVQMSQAAVLDAIKAWAGAVQSITQEFPAGGISRSPASCPGRRRPWLAPMTSPSSCSPASGSRPKTCPRHPPPWFGGGPAEGREGRLGGW